MPRFYETLLSSSTSSSNGYYISARHSLQSDHQDGEIWCCVLHTSNMKYSWRRVACWINERGIRVLQEFAFSAPEYKDNNTNRDIMDCKTK